MAGSFSKIFKSTVNGVADFDFLWNIISLIVAIIGIVYICLKYAI